MIIIFDLFETIIDNVTIDFNAGLLPLWEKYYRDKCTFDEIKAYGEELFEYMMELQIPLFKDIVRINITRNWNHRKAFSHWELGGRLMGSGYTGKDAFSLLNETFNKIKEQMNEEVYLGLPENLRDFLICGEEENIWNWTAA